MDWKEFLKPDLKKVVLPIIFIIVPIILQLILESIDCTVPTTSGFSGNISEACPLSDAVVDSINIYAYLSLLLTYPLIIVAFIFGLDFTSITLLFVPGLIYWYLISCTIFFGYDKFKSKK